MKKNKNKVTNQKERFVAARRNSDGSLKEFKSASGKVYNFEQALEAVEQGLIENALPFTSRDGTRHIRGLNDGKDKSNLKNLKKF
ncbi:MAG: DUF3892 domain-containing protein [Erysipelotrichaceae bacterium]